jgi:tetratricopeptide (TPR) repeat protein
MAQSSLWTCEYREGANRAERSQAYLDPDAGTLWRGMAAWFTTLHLALLGQLDRALDAARQTHALALSMGDRRIESYGLCLAAWVTGRKGNPTAGLAQCRPTLDIAPDANARMAIRCFLGQLAVAAGEVKLAKHELLDSFESSRAAGFTQFAAWNLAWLAIAELHQGDAARALRIAEDALAMADAVDFLLGRGIAHRARGLALAASGHADQAVASLIAALDTFLALGAAYDAAQSRLDLSRVLVSRGAREAAVGHLTAALSAFTEMNVELDSIGALQLARTLGVHVPPSKSSAG